MSWKPSVGNLRRKSDKIFRQQRPLALRIDSKRYQSVFYTLKYYVERLETLKSQISPDSKMLQEIVISPYLR
jgi:hypothetical protein